VNVNVSDSVGRRGLEPVTVTVYVLQVQLFGKVTAGRLHAVEFSQKLRSVLMKFPFTE